MRTQVAIWLGVVLSATLSACASYQPAPIAVDAVAAEHAARAVDPTAVRSELARLAPDYAWDGAEWNRLTLFAAAMTTNPEVERARASEAAAEADARVARVRPGLTLALTAEYAFDAPESSPWLVGAAGDVAIDRGGRREGRIEAADVAARAAAFDYANAVWSVRMRVRRALDARRASEIESDLAATLVSARQDQLAAVGRRVDAGAASRLDLDRVRADAADAARRRTAADSAAVAAGLDLAAALGVPASALDLDQPAAAPAADLAELPPLADGDAASALAARSEILAAAADYDRAEAALKSAVGAQVPEINIGPGYTWERGLSKLPVSLSLALPSADFGKAGIAAAEARREEAGRRLETAVADVLASVARADADYRAAWTELDLMRRETVPTARALAAQAQTLFDEGAIDRADWAASQAGYASARLDEAGAVRRVLDAEAALEDALRRPLSGPELAIGADATDMTEGDRP